MRSDSAALLVAYDDFWLIDLFFIDLYESRFPEDVLCPRSFFGRY